MSFHQFNKSFVIAFLKWAAAQWSLDVHNVSVYIRDRTSEGELGTVLTELNWYFSSRTPEALAKMRHQLPGIISDMLRAYHTLHAKVGVYEVGPGVCRNHQSKDHI